MFKFKSMFKDLCGWYKNYWKEYIAVTVVYSAVLYVYVRCCQRLIIKKRVTDAFLDEEEES